MFKTSAISAGAAEEVLFDEASYYESHFQSFPTRIHIRRGEAIDAIQLEYAEGKGELHGNANGGSPIHFELEEGDRIVRITGTQKTLYWNNKFLLSIQFHTQYGYEFGVSDSQKGVPTEGIPFKITLPEHMGLTCLYGGFAHPSELNRGYLYDLLLLSAIGAYYKPL